MKRLSIARVDAGIERLKKLIAGSSAENSPAGFDPRLVSEMVISFGEHCKSMQWRDYRYSLTFDQFAKGYLFTPQLGGKDGPCWIQGTTREDRRAAKNIDALYVIGLDCDAGHDIEELRAKVETKGWRAAIHSSFSHMKSETLVAVSAYDIWQRQHGNPGPEAYLREFKRMLPEIADGVTLDQEIVIDQEGQKYCIHHRPCPKFRLVMPLARPWRASDFPSQDAAIRAWHGHIKAVSDFLGIFIDRKCIDPSRLFFLPRYHDEAGRLRFVSADIPGEPCDVESLPRVADQQWAMSQALSGHEHRHRNRAGDDVQIDGIDLRNVVDVDGENVNLHQWVMTHGPRFLVADALQARVPDKIGPRPRTGGVHHECVRDEYHSSRSGDRTGSYAINAGFARAGGFYLGCEHDGCADVGDRLKFLAVMLVKGWLTVKDLNDPAFLIPDTGAAERERLAAQVIAVYEAAALRRAATPVQDQGTPATVHVDKDESTEAPKLAGNDAAQYTRPWRSPIDWESVPAAEVTEKMFPWRCQREPEPAPSNVGLEHARMLGAKWQAAQDARKAGGMAGC
jgi:hypothetical protein